MTKTHSWKAQSFNVIVMGMIAYLAYNFTNTVSLNVYAPAVAALKGVETSFLLYWNTIGGLVAIVASLLMGKLANKIPLKKYTVWGAIGGGIIYLLIPLVPTTLSGILVGANQIASMVYCQLVVGGRVGNWFPKRKGEILGIITAVIILSSLVGLPLLNAGIQSIGITPCMIIIGALMILWGVVSIFVVKDRPQDVGLYPENMSAEEASALQLNSGTTEKSEWTYGELLKNGRFWACSIGWGLILTCLVGVASVVVSVLLSKGMSQGTAVSIAAFAGVMQLLGSVSSGFIDTRLSQKGVNTLFVILAIVACAILAFAPNGSTVLLIIGFYMLMFMSGAPNNLMPSQYLTISGSGASFMVSHGLGLSIASVLRAFATTIMALSFDLTGGYNAALILFMVGCVVAVILINIGGYRKLEKK